MTASLQADLFGQTVSPPCGPDGFDYWPDLLSEGEQADVVAALQTLDYRPYEHRGYQGRRRIAAFSRGDLTAVLGGSPQAPWPGFLEDLFACLAARLDLDGRAYVQALVNEYAPGAGIGWHRDRPQYGEVVGLSLLAPCVMRLRRPVHGGWVRQSVPLSPGSIYRLRGAARQDWEHSINPMTALRYSITFRTLVGQVGTGRLTGDQAA
jgi:alkylated DNA repair dioxygenase AlkB